MPHQFRTIKAILISFVFDGRVLRLSSSSKGKCEELRFIHLLTNAENTVSQKKVLGH